MGGVPYICISHSDFYFQTHIEEVEEGGAKRRVLERRKNKNLKKLKKKLKKKIQSNIIR